LKLTNAFFWHAVYTTPYLVTFYYGIIFVLFLVDAVLKM
jgi:hypothetical protein